ncbi:MAG TPA: sigma-54 dependent transcriptional regulator [Phycisphaerae bacterium]|nr:sigma-54 dependent transcriptional regulator [Phycisphaerae bacterium]HRR86725.1 sigma-54 dependent transcriptional regulator [Phycisphaerae bacterium]
MSGRKERILIVDDDKIIVESLAEFLDLEGYEAAGAANFAEAVTALERKHYQLVITDVNMPDTDGFELLRLIKQRYPDIVVIMITGYGTIESAVEAIKMGAYDYLTKPIIDDEIRLVVERALQQQSLIRENRSLREALDLRYNLDNIVGHDYKMLKIFDLIEAVAESRTTVLIQGESGTGKTMIARAIHHRSDRRDKPFVEVSCGAIPESLLESELFGHVKGAFTGALGDKQGKFKAADKGTMFLDEISSATPALQVKLLRVLQERQFEPVGSNKTENVDVRVILASNDNLSQAVAAGRFRQDLYYRVNVVTIQLPALRERIGDIPLLAEHFLKRYCSEGRKQILGFTEECIQAMQRYNWPGNVRELENVVERAVVLTRNRRIEVDDLPPNVIEAAEAAPAVEGGYRPMSLKEALEEPEKRIIEQALRANNWNRQITAQVLEINRTTLYKKMKRYGLESESM